MENNEDKRQMTILAYLHQTIRLGMEMSMKKKLDGDMVLKTIESLMDKEEKIISSAYYQGCCDGSFNDKTCKQYFNETFKTK